MDLMLHVAVLVEPPLVDVLPPEPPLVPLLFDVPPLELLLPDEDEPPLVDEPLLDELLPEDALGGFAQDSLTPTILSASLAGVLYVPADGLCEHTFQLEVCTTERLSSLASVYVTEATWWARASATAFARFHPP
ncbi:hypothetical protein [Streptomyces sp. NBC_00102]|uniref:hypothetical protein n=1 Tax=Streptomyces sp. NBC_00102 TaxID=2975652 RepID=UPI0022560569|nr:hypothetical protein [Streptomyces sp. NBC_00102]MCX5396628.1 hypothetical protein [Streptomyces sp. NBC_00102]